MRAFFFATMAAFLSGAVLTSAVHADTLVHHDGWRILQTTMSYEDLVDRLNKSVKANKMGLVTRASATAGAKAAGITIPGNMIVGVYRNDYARRMLQASIAAGIEAPIRYYITENTDKTATLSYKTPSAVFAPYFEEGGEDLKTLASELDAVFTKIADEAVQ